MQPLRCIVAVEAEVRSSVEAPRLRMPACQIRFSLVDDNANLVVVELVQVSCGCFGVLFVALLAQ